MQSGLIQFCLYNTTIVHNAKSLTQFCLRTDAYACTHTSRSVASDIIAWRGLDAPAKNRTYRAQFLRAWTLIGHQVVDQWVVAIRIGRVLFLQKLELTLLSHTVLTQNHMSCAEQHNQRENSTAHASHGVQTSARSTEVLARWSVVRMRKTLPAWTGGEGRPAIYVGARRAGISLVSIVKEISWQTLASNIILYIPVLIYLLSS